MLDNIYVENTFSLISLPCLIESDEIMTFKPNCTRAGMHALLECTIRIINPVVAAPSFGLETTSCTRGGDCQNGDFRAVERYCIPVST